MIARRAYKYRIYPDKEQRDFFERTFGCVRLFYNTSLDEMNKLYKEKKEYKDGLTLPELIEAEKVETPEYVTVSINDEFVPTEEKATTILKDGDNVEFLYFMGGGC